LFIFFASEKKKYTIISEGWQAAGKTKRGQKADEAGRKCRNPPRSLHGCPGCPREVTRSNEK